MRFEVYGKPSCAMCKSTKDKLAHLLTRSAAPDAVSLSFIDTDTIEGMAESAFNDVRQIPTVILRSESGQPLARWEGRIPPAVEIQAFLASTRSVQAPQ